MREVGSSTAEAWRQFSSTISRSLGSLKRVENAFDLQDCVARYRLRA